MKGVLLKGMLGYDPERFGYQRDIQKAKELLDEAGYSESFKIELSYPQWGNLPRIAVLIQSNLSDIGVNVKLKEMAFGPFLEAVKNGALSIFPWEGSPAYNEPSGYLFPKLHSSKIGEGAGGNVARYSNPEVDNLLEKAMEEVDQSTRRKLYQQIDEMVTKDAYGIFLYQNVIRRPLRERVKNYTPPVLQGADFSKVYIEG